MLKNEESCRLLFQPVMGREGERKSTPVQQVSRRGGRKIPTLERKTAEEKDERRRGSGQPLSQGRPGRVNEKGTSKSFPGNGNGTSLRTWKGKVAGAGEAHEGSKYGYKNLSRKTKRTSRTRVRHRMEAENILRGGEKIHLSAETTATRCDTDKQNACVYSNQRNWEQGKPGEAGITSGGILVEHSRRNAGVNGGAQVHGNSRSQGKGKKKALVLPSEAKALGEGPEGEARAKVWGKRGLKRVVTHSSANIEPRNINVTASRKNKKEDRKRKKLSQSAELWHVLRWKLVLACAPESCEREWEKGKSKRKSKVSSLNNHRDEMGYAATFHTGGAAD